MQLARVPFALLITLAIFNNVSAQQAQVTQLEPNTPIERTLAFGESHSYIITLEAGQYLQFVVEQHGIDVVVHLVGPDHKPIGDFDSPNGSEGPENVSLVSDLPGVYGIVVTPLNEGQDLKPGKYEIRILELRKATDEELGSAVNREVLKTKATALVRDAVLAIPNIHSIVTRVHAQMQAANLLWDSDEKTASKLMADAVASLRQYINGLDLNDQESMQKLQPVNALRYELIQALATRDPEMALNFLRTTRIQPDQSNNLENRYPGQGSEEERLELTLASQVARKEPKRAFDLAEENLKARVSPAVFQTIMQLQSTSPELAQKLAKDVLTKLLEQKFMKNPESLELALNLIRYRAPARRQGANGGPTDVLSQDDRRDLIQKMLNEALAPLPTNNNPNFNVRDFAFNALNTLKQMGPDLENQFPGSQAAVEKRLKEVSSNFDQPRQDWQKYQDIVNSAPPETAAEQLNKAPAGMREQLFQQLAERTAATGDITRAKQIINEKITNPWQRRQALDNLARAAVYQYMAQGKIEDALRAIVAIRSPRERASLIAQTVSRIGPGRKRATAITLLEQTRSLLGDSIQADNQEEMNALLEIAAAFSKYEVKRSFEIVDPLIDQFNEISEASRKLSGFGQDSFADGELILHNGNTVATIANQLAKSLAMLGAIDIDHAKSTADRIQAPEVKLLIYLGVAKQIIQPQAGSSWFGYY